MTDGSNIGCLNGIYMDKNDTKVKTTTPLSLMHTSTSFIGTNNDQDWDLVLAEKYIDLYMRLSDESIPYIDIIWSLTPKPKNSAIFSLFFTLTSVLDFLE